MGQSARTGVFSSQPASRKTLRAYSGGCGSNVQAVSAPSSFGTPKPVSNCCDSRLRVMTNDSFVYRPHIHCSRSSMWPASPAYATESLFCAEDNPNDPIIIVVNAFANLLL